MAEHETSVVGEGFEGMAVDELVRRVHGGSLAVEDLPVGDRQRCVWHLTMEGFTCNEIVAVLGCSERTVRRDREAGRRERAVGPGVTLGDELLGEFQEVTMGSIARLMRLARDRETPAYAKLWAEEAVVRNYEKYIEMARRMAYVEDGKRRIAEERQRAEEPARREWRERQELGAKLVMERLRRMAGAEGEGKSWREMVDIVVARRGIKVEEYEEEEDE